MKTEQNHHYNQPQDHPFHLVELSPWPIMTSFSLLFVALGAVMLMHDYNMSKLVFGGGVLLVIFCVGKWWSDVIQEGRIGQFHTEQVRMGLKIGMILFILSEVMLFFAFFFSYFFSSLSPAGVLEGLWVVAEGKWPPVGIKTFDPWDIPFINTLILLLSGTTVTWAHHAITQDDQKNTVTALGLTVLLGITFSLLQAYEYHHAAFGLSDGVYAANFYLATGFHGIHVIVGTIFLTICYFRARKGHFAKGHGHLGFEFAAWYWHFVDVVWLFLFVFVYVLGR